MNIVLHGTAAVLVVAVAPATLAEDAARDFYIPTQALGSALRQLSRQSGSAMFYAYDTVKGRSSPALKGRYTVRQALEKLLAGSGLMFTLASDGSVSIKKAPEPTSAAALPRVTVTGKAAYEPNDPYNPSYVRSEASTATKANIPIMRTPMSVQVVPKAVMDDQQVITLSDSLKNVSGVQTSAASSDVAQDGFVIRGFETSDHIYRNGLRQTAFTFEPANLSQVEVLKGPAAVLYGRAQPGGIVNVVTKQPLADPYYSVQQQFGSYDLYRTAIDVGGPVDSERTLLYRTNLLYRNNNSFTDFVSRERVMVAPSVTWLVSDRTRLELSLEYQHENVVPAYRFPVVGKKVIDSPWNSNLSEPFSNHSNDRTVLEFAASHQFNADWLVRNRFQAQFQQYQQTTIFTTAVQADNHTLNRSLYDVLQDRTSYATNLELLGKLDTWGVKHDVLLGFDFYDFDWGSSKGNHCCAAVSPIDIYNPVHGGIDWKAIIAGPDNFFYHSTENWKGFYFQDLLSFADDQIHLLAGGRHDWVSIGSGFSGLSYSDANSQLSANTTDLGRFTPRVGITYQPQSWLSFYANYSEAFGSNNGGRSSSGKPFAPETSKQYEAGVKTEAFDGRLRATLAAYEITKSNVLTPTAVPGVSAVIGKARSKGVEFDISGEIDRNWSVIASYAYNDARIAGADPNKDNHLPRAPEHSGNAWLKYQFSGGWLDGFSLATGAFLSSQRYGDIANSYTVPGYVRWDLAAAYMWKVNDYRLTTRLNVNNVLNKHYFAFPRYRGSNYPADPLMVMGSLQLEF